MAPSREELLCLMDLNMWEMYREMTRVSEGGELRETRTLTMQAVPDSVVWNNLVHIRGPVDPEELVAEVRAFYVARRLPFAVYTRAHADAALEEALTARGFTLMVANPGMALLEDSDTPYEAPGLEVRAATDDQARRDFLHVSAEAYATYDQPKELAGHMFASLASVCAPGIQGFVGYVGGEPAAAAALYMTHGVAGVGEVGTVPAHRGRRYAEAVTWAVVREGFRRGATFSNLQAAPMGVPVYQRMGFQALTEYRVFVGNV